MAGAMIGESGSLGLYFRDIASSRPLSSEEEVELTQPIRSGNRKARNKLVGANLKFVVKLAGEYRGRGMALEDLISAGNVGLMTAAERFDGRKGFKFVTYAAWWIRRAIRESLMGETRLVRLPVNRLKLLHRISDLTRKLNQRRGEEPETETIAEGLGVSPDIVRDTLVRAQGVKSLDASLHDEDESLLHLLPDADQPAPDARLEEETDRLQLGRLLDALEDREAQVLRLNFGLDQEQPVTLTEIAKQLGVTKERVRQIKEKALHKLRHPQNRRELNSLIG